MREILTRIKERQADYAKGKFLGFLRDKSIDIADRLAFTPYVAHFVLTFADLCTIVLPRHPAGDWYQELVNANSLEDKRHWEWFLSDLGQLGVDAQMPFSKALEIVWGDASRRTRKLSYHLVHLGGTEDSLTRLVLVHIIEGAFQATVKDLEPAAHEFMAKTGKQLQYLGMRHSESEASHTIEDHATRSKIESIPLSPAQLATYTRMVDDSFAMFRDFSDEMYDLAIAHAKNPRP